MVIKKLVWISAFVGFVALLLAFLPVQQSNWILRSHHFIYGMPVTIDSRYDFDADGDGINEPGISVLVREGFVVGHCDKYKIPLWVSAHWTKKNCDISSSAPDYDRDFEEDFELPPYARALSSYNGTATSMDRGHMSAHKTNAAWGEDNSDAGCLMSNIAPQHLSLNRGPWKNLEIAIRNIVASGQADEIWIITGTIIDKPADPRFVELEGYYENVANSVKVPYATYKIASWFDSTGAFIVRGFVLEQSERSNTLTDHLFKIDDIENWTGIDFFPELEDSVESSIENTSYDSLGWSIATATTAATTQKATATVQEPTQTKKPDESTRTVYITGTGKKYHSAGCRYLKKSSTPISLKDAKARGYTPCSVCNPPR